MADVQTVKPENYQGLVSVEWIVNSSNSPKSQGTLIGDNLVLTNAEFLTDSNLKPGSTYAVVNIATGIRQAVSAVRVHPGFEKVSDSYYRNPLMLLVATDKLGKGVGIQTSGNVKPGAKMTTIGWCHSGPQRNTQCDNVWKMNVTVTDESKCSSASNLITNSDLDGIFCSSTVGNNGCPGEAASIFSPDLSKSLGLSIFTASSGPNVTCGDPNTVGVNLEYGAYLNWISAATGASIADLVSGNVHVDPANVPPANSVPSSAPTPVPDPTASGKSNTLAIALGTVGGVLALAIIVFAVLRYKYGMFGGKKKNGQAADGSGAAAAADGSGGSTKAQSDPQIIYVMPVVPDYSQQPVVSAATVADQSSTTFGLPQMSDYPGSTIPLVPGTTAPTPGATGGFTSYPVNNPGGYIMQDSSPSFQQSSILGYTSPYVSNQYVPHTYNTYGAGSGGGGGGGSGASAGAGINASGSSHQI
ncbi:hypothetical protein GQ42DRAFT_178389 [Ramicandelaber brevisporus]|nr:hypothetical protein GQ42DRAFT_178389 [Ramicandelaber brevisporus]